MGEEKPAGARSLVSSVLAEIDSAPRSPTRVPRRPPEPVDPAAEAVELIEVYFEMEEPSERDAVFDRLAQIDSPVVTEFLRSMLEADEDEYVRAAAAELARRGDPEALAQLEQDLDDPEEPFFFEHAVQVLSEIRGAGFYDTLRAIWQDPERDGDQRREAMLGMEHLDLERTIQDFVGLVEGSIDVDSMQDDQIEAAIMAFVRHGYDAAVPALERLRDRVAASPIDPEEAAELRDFIQEGIELLRS